MSLELRKTNGGLIFRVKAVPGSSRNRIAGLHDGAAKINIAAAPEKGKANKELVAFLAQTLEVPKSAVAVISGEHDHRKEVAVRGLSAEEIVKRMGLP